MVRLSNSIKEPDDEDLLEKDYWYKYDFPLWNVRELIFEVTTGVPLLAVSANRRGQRLTMRMRLHSGCKAPGPSYAGSLAVGAGPA